MNIKDFEHFRDTISNADAEKQMIYFQKLQPLEIRLKCLAKMLNLTDKEIEILKFTIIEPYNKLSANFLPLPEHNWKEFIEMKDVRYNPDQYTNIDRNRIMDNMQSYYNSSVNNIKVIKQLVIFLENNLDEYLDSRKSTFETEFVDIWGGDIRT